ncbi:hypothetical protein C8R43DRAFT_1106735 [Mycena crocata]|nr:hypothetical protein C8R43DRAFT_1106735 [Mycena crocata]
MLALGNVSRLLSLPPEILEQIAYELVCLTPLGPPAALVPLLLTCKSVYNLLFDNAPFYSRIFRFKFDASAVARRAFHPTPRQYFDQLVMYCTQLQKLRGQVWDGSCADVLFCAYLMMLENDGRNAAQLAHAGLDSYLDIFVRTRMWDDSKSANGWPTDSTENACALWLMWMTTTEDKLKEESPARRTQIIKLVLPYVLVPCRYASTLAPQNHFNLPLLNAVAAHSNSIITAHGPYPIYLDPRRAWSQIHFSSRPCIIPPLVTIAAKLVYFSRREIIPFGIPPHLPLNREQALAAGITRIGPNQDDIKEVNEYLNHRLPEVRPGWGADDIDEPLSKRWDSDWWRLRKCFNAFRKVDRRLGSVYEPGTFTGLWQGRMLVPSEHHLNALITTPDYPPTFDEGFLGTTTVPLFMRVQEHHSYAPHKPAPCGGPGAGNGTDDGIGNAYFPRGTRFVASDARGVTVRIEGDDTAYEYVTHGVAAAHNVEVCAGCREREETLRAVRVREAAAAHEELFARVGLGVREAMPDADVHITEGNGDGGGDRSGDSEEGEGDGEGDPGDSELPPTPPAHDPNRVPPCNGIQDIIFTGATDLRHGQAWNHFEFYGRLRPWDGMIGILRISPDPRLGTLFFYGFVVGGHKFVGNWRIAHQDASVPAYESAFTMARRDD